MPPSTTQQKSAAAAATEEVSDKADGYGDLIGVGVANRLHEGGRVNVRRGVYSTVGCVNSLCLPPARQVYRLYHRLCRRPGGYSANYTVGSSVLDRTAISSACSPDSVSGFYMMIEFPLTSLQLVMSERQYRITDLSEIESVDAFRRVSGCFICKA